MAKETYVARGTIKFGAPDGSTIYFNDGDVITDMTDAQVLELRQIGSAIPKSVWDALFGAETALAEAQAAQEAANVEAQQQQAKIVATPQRALAEAQQRALQQNVKSSAPLLPQEVGQAEPQAVVEVPVAPKAEPPKAESPKAEPKSGPQVRAKSAGTKE
jgi:hypothetical protein